MSTFCKSFPLKNPPARTPDKSVCRLMGAPTYALAVFILALSLAGATDAQGQGTPIKPALSPHRQTIVLDPGHGGRDPGAKGPGGTVEKTVTLALARMLADELGAQYRVVLTRNDDYWLDVTSRTDVANHLEADLFISIHIGGAFLHQAGGISIFYFKEFSEPSLSPAEPLKSTGSADPEIPWNQIQTRHTVKSKMLSEVAGRHLSGTAKLAGIRIQGAPLLVLEGADMPAILIEPGYLTNPVEEKALCDMDVLSDLTNRIRNAIEEFLPKTTP